MKSTSPTRALVLVDLQNDFVENGSLAVPDGQSVIPIANELLERFEIKVATQDWHPANHLSFASQHASLDIGDQFSLNGLPQIAWPDHCIQQTHGACFVPELNAKQLNRIVQKGTDPEIDSYSGFFDNGGSNSTGLHEWLTEMEVTRVYIMGLATDYCVKFTVMDSARLGYETFLIDDGCRGVDLTPGDVENAIADMKKDGIKIVQSQAITT